MDIRFEPLKRGKITTSSSYAAIDSNKKHVFLAQDWSCSTQTSRPSPIIEMMKIVPLLSFHNGEAKLINGFGGKKYDDALEKFFYTRVVSLKPKAMQAKLDKELGTQRMEIPFKKYVFPKYRMYSLTFYSVVRYAYFRVTWKNMKQGHWVILSIPLLHDHSLSLHHKCQEDGTIALIPHTEDSYFEELGSRKYKPKTKTARKLFISHKKAKAIGLKEKIKELEDQIKNLEEEAQELEGG